MTSFVPPEYGPVLIKIYDLSVTQKEKVTFAKLTEYFDKKEVYTALEHLCNHCIIDDIWDKSSGQWVRTFEIQRQYVHVVKLLKEAGNAS